MAATARVGMNLANVNYWGTEYPFIDRMKAAGWWVANGATEPVVLTPEGYPRSVPKGADSVYTMLGMDPHAADYVLTYEGGAAPYMAGARITKTAPGRVEFSYDASSDHQMLMAFGNVAGLRNVRIFLAAHEARLSAGEIFNPAFIEKIRSFDTLRYMDWINTNVTKVQRWSDRTQVNSRTWDTSLDTTMPIEIMVALANTTRTNMWLNAPTMADDDFVRQMMTYVRDHLDPALSVRLEYSNEVWNWKFGQAGYAHIEAAKLWGTDANGDGKVDPFNQAEQMSSGWVTWYGYRAAQVARVARSVFGADKRLRPVLATQTGYRGIEAAIIDGVARAKVGTVDELFDDYAVTNYFGALTRGTVEADRPTILAWARSGADGVTAALAAMRDGTGMSSDAGSLAEVKRDLAYQAGVAAKFGLALVAYEGGSDLGSDGFGAEAQEVYAFMMEVQADPRMGELYAQMIADFAAAGGTLSNVLIDVDPGLYGTLKSIYDTGSPAWNALVAVEQAAGYADEPALPDPTPTPSPAVPSPAPSPLPVPSAPKVTKAQIYAATSAARKAISAHLSNIDGLVKAYKGQSL